MLKRALSFISFICQNRGFLLYVPALSTKESSFVPSLVSSNGTNISVTREKNSTISSTPMAEGQMEQITVGANASTRGINKPFFEKQVLLKRTCDSSFVPTPHSTLRAYDNLESVNLLSSSQRKKITKLQPISPTGSFQDGWDKNSVQQKSKKIHATTRFVPEIHAETLAEGHNETKNANHTQAQKKTQVSFIIRDRVDALINANHVNKDKNFLSFIPQVLFISHIPQNTILIKEATRLQIPIIGILDTDANPLAIDFPIPGNDDEQSAHTLYTKLILNAIIQGKKKELKKIFNKI